MFECLNLYDDTSRYILQYLQYLQSVFRCSGRFLFQSSVLGVPAPEGPEAPCPRLGESWEVVTESLDKSGQFPIWKNAMKRRHVHA